MLSQKLLKEYHSGPSITDSHREYTHTKESLKSD